LERNHKDIFADKRLLSRFLKQAYSAYNTPSLITLVAQDDNYIELCGFISNTNKKDNPKLFHDLNIECQKQGFDIYTIQLKLNPVSTALGLVKSSKVQLNYYDLLGVKPSADMADIRKAYRELARKTHPDTGKNGDSKTFVELNEAYQTLIDPDLRYYYDQSRQNLALWNEQSDRPQKQKKRLRSLYQIGLILLFFVFAAYLSDIIFHQKAITDDPYSKKVNDEAKLEGNKVIHNENNEFKDRQKALIGESTSAVPSGDSRRVEEGMPGPKSKSSEVFSHGLAENGRITRGKHIILEASTRKRKKDGPIEDKVIAVHASIEGPVLGEEKKDKEASKGSSSETSQERLLASVNFMGVESSGVHSERLSKEDVHIIKKDTNLSVGMSKDTPKALSVSRRDGIVSKVSRAEELIESRESQLKRLARLSADKNEKEINAMIQNQATKEKTARKLSPKRLSKEEDIQVILKDAHLSADIQEDTQEVLLTLGQADISTELSGLEEQAEFTESPLKRLASIKAAEEKQQLDSRLNAFLRNYCREYENKDIEKFANFFAPDAIEKGKPFTKLIYKYKKNFKAIKDIKYAIRIGSYSKEVATESIFLAGTFSLNWRMNDGPFNESTGDIYFTLHENGDSFLVKRLDYTFKR